MSFWMTPEAISYDIHTFDFTVYNCMLYWLTKWLVNFLFKLKTFSIAILPCLSTYSQLKTQYKVENTENTKQIYDY